MKQYKINYNLILNFLLCCCVFICLNACSNVNNRIGGGKLNASSGQTDLADSNQNVFAQTSKKLAKKIYRALEHESRVKWTSPLLVEFAGDKWNSFLDQLNIFVMEELSNKNIQLVRRDWEFSEDEFTETNCPDELLFPGYVTKIKIKHYKQGQNFLVTAETRRYNSRRVIQSGVNAVTISGADYKVALQAWNEPQSRWQKPPLGSRSNPFARIDKVAEFLARLLPCKMDKASELWKKYRHEDLDFSRLSYKMVASSANKTGVSDSLVQRVTARINQQLMNTGIQVVVADDDLKNVINQASYLDRFKPYYLDNDRSSGEIRLNAPEALIVVEITPAEAYSGIYEVVLRTIISSSVIENDIDAQGIMIPALGGECFFSASEPLSFNMSPRQPQLNDNFFITITGRVKKVTSLRIFEGQKCIYPNLCSSDDVGLDFARKSVFRVPELKSPCKFIRNHGSIRAKYNYDGKEYIATILVPYRSFSAQKNKKNHQQKMF